MALLTPTLQLGDFFFTGFEEPTEVTFGKEQSVYKHILIGGGRVIDLLGAGDPDITWSGYFTGSTAENRARFLDGLTKSGKPLLLKTSQFVKNVVITNFTYGFHFVFPISYTITLQVIQDNTLPISFAIPGDLTIVVLSALLEMQDIATLINNPSVANSIALALLAAQEAAPFLSATSGQVNNALLAAQSAVTTINGAIQNVEKSLFGSAQ